MRIAHTGILNPTAPGTNRAFSTFPSVVVLPDSRLVAAYRVGSSKDCDDETIELRDSADLGLTWSEPRSGLPPFSEGRHKFSLKLVYFTVLAARKILAAAMAVDRTAYPGQPLFNATQGCLPMRILVSESRDMGATWDEWRIVETPADIGPPSLTNPVLRLRSGRLAMSIESNKEYRDTGQWLQKVTYLFSDDEGVSWGKPTVVSEDSSGRIFNWDQRAAVTPDGGIVTFTWVFDAVAGAYRNIWKRISVDNGLSWTEPEDIGFADQASCPAVFPDGRIVLAWVDRFGSQSIRARIAANLREPFEGSSEIVLYNAPQPSDVKAGLGETLDEMSRWSYGLPFAHALPDGDALVLYYAGSPDGTSVHWSRLTLD